MENNASYHMLSQYVTSHQNVLKAKILSAEATYIHSRRLFLIFLSQIPISIMNTISTAVLHYLHQASEYAYDELVAGITDWPVRSCILFVNQSLY